jgi:hypothetical protein
MFETRLLLGIRRIFVCPRYLGFQASEDPEAVKKQTAKAHLIRSRGCPNYFSKNKKKIYLGFEFVKHRGNSICKEAEAQF